ncbi:hypothetical protein VTH06DRAFT_902 [Thermothelomyces fergusii]
MEQTLSTLHKQNFDLKLELYHRRERQAALEARVEILEREAKERDGLYNSLLRELERRDKAVEEAIGMILALERRVEELLLERKIIHQVEAEKPPCSRLASLAMTPRSQSKRPEFATPGDAPKTPIRMPSFVSERSENTEHLRSVYMAGLGSESSLSLPRMVEDTPDTTRIDPRLASPALSELSESSFASVYGRGRTADLPSTPEKYPAQRDIPSRAALPGVESPSRAGTSTPVRHRRRSGSRAASGQFHTISGVMASTPSPPQRTKGSEPKQAAPRDSQTLPAGKTERSPIVLSSTSHSQANSKKEKREALEKFITQAQLSSPQTLPPTPDTLSTTTLPNRETPVKDQGLDSEHNCRDLTEADKTETAEQPEPGSPSSAAQPASVTAFDSRKWCHATERLSVATSASPGHCSPQSTTDSAYARSPNGDNWSDDASGYTARHRRDSTTSSIDTWLRESLKPESAEGLSPMSSASRALPDAADGRVSPDLFSFPTSAQGWMANTMLGPPRGQANMSPHAKNMPVAPAADMPDAAGASMPSLHTMNTRHQTPINGAAALSPPNRRSSLLSRTGAPADVLTPGTAAIPQSPPRPCTSPSSKVNGCNPHGSRPRRNSTDVRSVDRHSTKLGLKQGRAMTVPPKPAYPPPPPPNQQHRHHPEGPIKQDARMQLLPKHRHYPPPSQTFRTRSRGLTALFRRSMGSADVPAPPASAPPTQTAFKPPPPSLQRTGSGSEATAAAVLGMGIPSWVRRSSLADGERPSGATPPPILRQKKGNASSRPSYADGSGVVDARGAGPGDDEDGDGGVVLDPSPDAAAGTPGSGVPVGKIPPSPAKPSWSPRKSWPGGTSGVMENGEGGGVSLAGGGTCSGNGSGSSGSGKRKWLGLGRVSSLRNRGGT